MTKKIFDTSSQVTKKQTRNISDEPEMIELKRMIRAGELDPGRTVKHIVEVISMETKPKEGTKDKMLTVRISEELHRALKIRAVEEGRTVAVIISELIKKYLSKGE